MSRDLVSPASMNPALTREQRATFERDGVVRLDGVVPADLVAAAQTAVRRPLEAAGFWRDGAWRLDALPRPVWPDHGVRTAKTIGNKSVLFMANHGVTTLGVTVADAYDRLYYLERAAQVQIYAMWTGQPLKQLPPAVIEKTKRDIGGTRFYYGPTPAERHFNALKRILDRTEPDYKS